MLYVIQTQITGLQCNFIQDAISNKPQKETSGLREFCAYSSLLII